MNFRVLGLPPLRTKFLLVSDCVADPNGELDPAEAEKEIPLSEFDDLRWGVRKPSEHDLVKLRMKETSGYYSGVTYNRQNGKWAARLLEEGMSLSIGYYDTEAAAVAASNIYQDAKW